MMRNSMHIIDCAVVTCKSKGTVSSRRRNAAKDQNKRCVSHAHVGMGYKLHRGQGRPAIHFDTCNYGPSLTYTAHREELHTLQTQYDCSVAVVVIPPAMLGCLVSTCKAVGCCCVAPSALSDSALLGGIGETRSTGMGAFCASRLSTSRYAVYSLV